MNPIYTYARLKTVTAFKRPIHFYDDKEHGWVDDDVDATGAKYFPADTIVVFKEKDFYGQMALHVAVNDVWTFIRDAVPMSTLHVLSPLELLAMAAP